MSDLTQKDLQAATKNLNETLGIKLPIVGAKKEVVKENIVNTVASLIDETGQWKDPRGGELAPETIKVYENLVAAMSGGQTTAPETTEGAGDATVDPGADVVAGPEAGEGATPKECPSFGIDPDMSDPACAECKRREECAAAVAAKAAANPAEKKRGKKEKAAKEPKGPGVIATILDIVKSGPHSKEEILTKLTAAFPSRDATSMKNTINVQLPARMSKERGVEIVKDEQGRFFVKS